MAAFEYKALDAKGKSKKGSIEADNARQARQISPIFAQKSEFSGNPDGYGHLEKLFLGRGWTASLSAKF